MSHDFTEFSNLRFLPGPQSIRKSNARDSVLKQKFSKNMQKRENSKKVSFRYPDFVLDGDIMDHNILLNFFVLVQNTVGPKYRHDVH